jgi:outer membrane assembly lipoprotein YfiO
VVCLPLADRRFILYLFTKNVGFVMKRTLCLFGLFFGLAGCVQKHSGGLVLSEKELYLKAKTHLLNSEFLLAANDFEKIEEVAPFTAEANKGIIMASYSYYKSNDYDESLRLIEYYKKINFGSENLEYLYFLEILNNLKKVEKSSKDISLVRGSIGLIDDFLARFSKDSIYGEYLLQQKRGLIDIYTKRELEVVDFYIFNNNLLGALNHLKGMEFYGDKYEDEINYRFFELYKHINYERGAEQYFLLLEKNKNTRWYKYAKKKS